MCLNLAGSSGNQSWFPRNGVCIGQLFITITISLRWVNLQRKVYLVHTFEGSRAWLALGSAYLWCKGFGLCNITADDNGTSTWGYKRSQMLIRMQERERLGLHLL